MTLGLAARFGEKRLVDFLSVLPLNEARAIHSRLKWRHRQARENQLPPSRDGMWRVWLMQGGRGSGKTRPGAEWTWYESWADPGTISHVVARRDVDHKTTTFGGPSGLLSVIPYELIEKKTEGPWAIHLKHPTSAAPNAGSKILGFTASEPGTLRGPQCHRSWADELAAWDKIDDAWTQVQLSTRLRSERHKVARIVVTTTPRPKPVIAALNKRFELESKRIAEGKLDELARTIVINRYSTFENAANLDPETLNEYRRIYEGTKVGRQELYAELIDPAEAGIVRKSQIKLWPAFEDAGRTKRKDLPEFDLVIISLDTGYREEDLDDETGDPDPTACGVWGLFTNWVDKKPRQDVMLLYAWAERLAFHELLEKCKEEMRHKYGRVRVPIIKPVVGPGFLHDDFLRSPDLMLIEDKSSGISLRQVMAAEGFPTFPYNPGKASKLLRLHTVSHLFPHGRVWMPESDRDERAGEFMDWCDPVIEQLTTFAGEGTIAHDDHVDQTTQLLRLVYDQSMGAVTPERIKELREKAEEAARNVLVPVAPNPYAS